jgi:hemerythrin
MVRARVLPLSSIERRPAVLWYVRECFERRIAMLKVRFDFRWKAEYDLDIESLDSQHHLIFTAIDGIVDASGDDLERRLGILAGMLSEHFTFEESLQRDAGYPGVHEHKAEHDSLLDELEGMEDRLRTGTRGVVMADFMKDCFVRHTLVMDRQFLPWVKPAAPG